MDQNIGYTQSKCHTKLYGASMINEEIDKYATEKMVKTQSQDPSPTRWPRLYLKYMCTKHGIFMILESFLTVSDYVHIENQVFTLKWWKYIICNQL